MTTVTTGRNSSEIALPVESPTSRQVSAGPRIVRCSNGRRELWLLAIVLITGILMAAVVLLPAALT
ncbi:MAG: hypothetical protein WBF79_07845 [Rhodococcus sp. (in: high G+C Gram-positive bacteria)]